ncbi:MAG TPA: hypothetical protein V6D00_10450 [Pantanalinema sp.]
MTRLRHKGLCLGLAASLAMVSMTGCGVAVPSSFSQDGASGASRASATTRNGVELASAFAEQMKQGGAKVRLAGAVVTVETKDVEAVSYDFTQTPKTGKVTFRAGEVVTTLDYDADSKMIPVRVVYVAAKMLYGGAKAWYWYTKTHEGASYKKEELVKAILYGVISEGLGGLPFGFLWERLTPYVWKWVTGEAPLKPTLRELFELVKKDLLGISTILIEAETLKRAN